MAERDNNERAFQKYLDAVKDPPKFVAFVDGDPVESGNDFSVVALNSAQLRDQRGQDAVLTIFSVPDGAVTPP